MAEDQPQPRLPSIAVNCLVDTKKTVFLLHKSKISVAQTHTQTLDTLRRNETEPASFRKSKQKQTSCPRTKLRPAWLINVHLSFSFVHFKNNENKIIIIKLNAPPKFSFLTAPWIWFSIFHCSSSCPKSFWWINYYFTIYYSLYCSFYSFHILKFTKKNFLKIISCIFVKPSIGNFRNDAKENLSVGHLSGILEITQKKTFR